MKKITSVLLCVLFLAAVVVGAMGCNKESLLEEETRYTYTNGVHDLTAPDCADEWLVKDGKTEYVLITPSDADETVTTAASEFTLFFSRATGIDIPTVRDSDSESVYLTDSAAKRISLGETTLVKNMSEAEKEAIGYDKETLGSDGVRIKKQGNTVYLLGGGSAGVLYAVYDFLQICFNYEFYYRNCIEIDTDVNNLKMKDFDVTDIPDVQIRSYGNNIALFDEAWSFEIESGEVTEADISRAMSRYRVVNSSDIFLPIYETYSGTAYNYGYHNSAYFVNEKDGEWRSSWRSDAGIELCYTAHGSEEDLEALVTACANKLIYSLQKSEWQDREYVGFTVMDGGYQCTCSACEAARAKDGGSYCGAIVRVANRIMEKVDAWKKENGQADRKLTMFFFAYGTTEPAPVVLEDGKYVPANDEVICRDDVAVYLCTHNSSRSIYYANGEYEEDLEELEKWRAVAKHMFNWFYQQRYRQYSAYFDTFSMLNNDMYAYALNCGSAFMFNQGDYRGETVTGYGALNEYVFSRMMWDSSLKVEDLCKKFFKAMYKDAADTMYEIFTSEREYSITISQDDSVGEYNYSTADSASLFPYKTHLLPLIEKYEQALSEIEVLKTTSPSEYELVKARIETEYVAPLYLTLSLYGSNRVMPFSNEQKQIYKETLSAIVNKMDFRCYEGGASMKDFVDGL